MPKDLGTKRALFSVIMPAYNCASTVSASIDSVLNQSQSDLELIVVDDCSSDGTADVLADFERQDSRVHVLYLSKNCGVAMARNTAIEAACGRYIAFLDSDDLWLPTKLAVQKRYFDEGHTLLFSSYVRFGDGVQEKTVFARSSISYRDLLHGNQIGNLTGAYDVDQLGKFFQQPIRHEDYLMWLQIIKKSGVATGIPDVLARYRVRSGSVSASKFNSALWTWQLYRVHLNLGWIDSAGCFLAYLCQGLGKRL